MDMPLKRELTLQYTFQCDVQEEKLMKVSWNSPLGAKKNMLYMSRWVTNTNLDYAIQHIVLVLNKGY